MKNNRFAQICGMITVPRVSILEVLIVLVCFSPHVSNSVGFLAIMLAPVINYVVKTTLAGK